jgi:hypothetical protein
MSETLKVNASVSDKLDASDPDNDALTFSIVDAPAHGDATLLDESIGSFTYTPNQNYKGSDAFTFKANDGRADSNTATVAITVHANHPPVAEDSTLSVSKNAKTVGVLAATDADDDPLSYSILSNPAHGTLNHDGARFTYTPYHGYLGKD